MLYKKYPSNKPISKESDRINKFVQYTKSFVLSKQNPINPSHANTIIESMSFSSSRNIPINLKANYTTTINGINQNNADIKNLQLTRRKNQYLQEKISKVLEQIKKTNLYYPNPSTSISKSQFIERLKSRSKGRPKSKKLKLLEMKIMLNHPLKSNQINSKAVKSSLDIGMNNISKAKNTLSNRKRIQSESDQKDIDNFSKEFNTNNNLKVYNCRRKILSRNNNNNGKMKRTFSGYNDSLNTLLTLH